MDTGTWGHMDTGHRDTETREHRDTGHRNTALAVPHGCVGWHRAVPGQERPRLTLLAPVTLPGDFGIAWCILCSSAVGAEHPADPHCPFPPSLSCCPTNPGPDPEQQSSVC